MAKDKPNKQTDNAPKQATPKGLEIPVPKRSEILDALDKAARTSASADGSEK